MRYMEAWTTRSERLQRWGLPALAGVVGVALTLSAWQALGDRDDRLNEEALRSHAELRVQALKEIIADGQGVAAGLSAYFAGSQLVERWEWPAFGTPLLNRSEPAVVSLQWAPRVWQEADVVEPEQWTPRPYYPLRREAHAAVVEAEAGEAQPILELDPQRQELVPAAEREQHFPLTYQVTAEDAWAAGFDWWSNPAARAAMERAVQRDESILSERLDPATREAVTGQPGELSLLVEPIFFKAGQIEPIDSVERRWQKLRGFVVVAIRPVEALAQAMQHVPVAGIDLHVFDVSVQDEPVLRELVPSRLHRDPVQPYIVPGEPVPTRMYEVLEARIGGRDALVYATPTVHFMRMRRTWAPTIALGSGLAVSVMLVGLLATMTTRTQGARQEALRRRVHAGQQRAVAEFGLASLREPSLEKLMDQAVELVTQTLAVKFASVLELQPDGKTLLLRAGGHPPEVPGELAMEVDSTSLVGYTLLSEEPIVVEDLSRETRFQAPALERHGVVSGVSTLIVSTNGEPCGVLGAYDTQPRTFTRDEVDFLQTMANVLGQTMVQRRIEGELRESEARFRAMADAAPVLVWLADTDKRCTYLNRQWLAFTGRSMEQELGEGWTEGIHPEDYQQCLATYHDAFDRREPFRMSYRLRRADGAYRWMLDEGVPRFAPDGTFAGYIGSCTDVTDQKQAEQQLRTLNETLERRVNERTESLKRANEGLRHEIAERKRIEEASQKSEQQFRILANTATDAIVLADRRGRITYFNPAAERMFGYSAAEAVDQPLTLLMPPRFHEAHWRGFNRYLETREPTLIGKTVELVGQHRSGREFPVEISLAVHERESELIFTGILRDITERKRAEAEVQRTAASLERSNRELEQFAYIASHDLQEPLRKVEGFGEMLQDQAGDALDEEARAHLQRIYAATQRMRGLINGLLSYSRITTKRRPFERVNLNEVAKEVLTDLEMRIHDTGGRVEVEELPTLHADRVQMHQLLQNLIANGLKFHRPEVPPRVRVYAEPAEVDSVEAAAAEPREAGEGPFWRVCVADNGIGIAPQYVDQLFMPFRRLHGHGSRYAGTGIGLAVCRKIVERHGGRINLESTPGEGTTFIVTLPRPSAEPVQQEAETS